MIGIVLSRKILRLCFTFFSYIEKASRDYFKLGRNTNFKIDAKVKGALPRLSNPREASISN